MCDIESNEVLTAAAPLRRSTKVTVAIISTLGALSLVGFSMSASGNSFSFGSTPSTGRRLFTKSAPQESAARLLDYSTTDPAFPIITPTGNSGLVISTDFLTRELFRKQFLQSTDFVVNLDSLGTAQTGGTIRAVDAGAFPALSGEGVAMAVIDFAPCGINSPHVHPRATEMVYFIEGEQFMTVFVEENSGRLIQNVVNAGMTTIFPMGLVHLVANLSCNTAKLVASFGSANPGTLTLSTQGYTQLKDNAAAAASLSLSAADLATLVAGFQANPMQDPVCLARCGL